GAAHHVEVVAEPQRLCDLVAFAVARRLIGTRTLGSCEIILIGLLRENGLDLLEEGDRDRATHAATVQRDQALVAGAEQVTVAFAGKFGCSRLAGIRLGHGSNPQNSRAPGRRHPRQTWHGIRGVAKNGPRAAWLRRSTEHLEVFAVIDARSQPLRV